MIRRRGVNGTVVKYWLEHYLGTPLALCVLCGNTGTIQLASPVRSPAGVAVRATSTPYCICPNGQVFRREAKKLQPTGEA